MKNSLLTINILQAAVLNSKILPTNYRLILEEEAISRYSIKNKWLQGKKKSNEKPLKVKTDPNYKGNSKGGSASKYKKPLLSE